MNTLNPKLSSKLYKKIFNQTGQRLHRNIPLISDEELKKMPIQVYRIANGVHLRINFVKTSIVENFFHINHL